MFIVFFDKTPLNRIAPDGMPHFAASHLGLNCLSHLIPGKAYELNNIDFKVQSEKLRMVLDDS